MTLELPTLNVWDRRNQETKNMEFNEEEFLERLVFLRQNLTNLSMRETSRALGWKPSAYPDLEAGRKRCTIQNLMALTKLYSVDANYLLTGDPKGLSERTQQIIQKEIVRQMQRTSSVYKDIA